VKKIFLVIFIAVLLFGLVASSCAPVTGKTTAPVSVTITDSAGREVEVPYPVDRAVVVYSQVLLAIKALGVSDDKIIGLDEFTYDQYENVLTGLKGKPTVGVNMFDLDIEKIIGLNTQVLIVSPTTLSQMPELEAQLDRVGIKIVALNFAISNVEGMVSSLGQMFGKEERAVEFASFWFSKLDIVKQRVEQLEDEEKVRVYWEKTSSGYITISKQSATNEIIEMAGGINIARDLMGSSPTVDPEWVIAQDPDVIVQYPMGADYQGGFGQTDTEPFKVIVAEIEGRPGFEHIKAIKNGEVYVMSQVLKTGVFENVAICYMAKLLYPELFRDLDAEAYFKEMMGKYLDLDYEEMEGVFVYPDPLQH
jgi:iron complex transport system substrate-binding protein